MKACMKSKTSRFYRWYFTFLHFSEALAGWCGVAMMDWEDALVAVGLMLLIVAAYLAYGWAGVIGFVGLILVTVGAWVAIWRREQRGKDADKAR